MDSRRDAVCRARLCLIGVCARVVPGAGGAAKGGASKGAAKKPAAPRKKK